MDWIWVISRSNMATWLVPSHHLWRGCTPGTPLIRVAPNLFWIAMSRYARMIPTDLFCGGQHGIVAKQKQHSENSCKTSNNYNSKWYYCILLLVKFVSHFHTTSEYYQANCFWDFSSGALCAKTLFLSWAQRSRASGTWLPASLDGRLATVSDYIRLYPSSRK